MNLGMPEMLFIFLLALIIFGPRKLPEIGRQLGKALTEFKRASNEFKMQIEDEIRQLEFTEEQKRIQPAATIEGNVPSYAASASAAVSAPEGTIAHDHDGHVDESAASPAVALDADDNGLKYEAPLPAEPAGEAPASTPPAAAANSMTAHQGSDV